MIERELAAKELKDNAIQLMEKAVEMFVLHKHKTAGLSGQTDGRVMAIAQTHLETALLWAQRS